jgi:hypothetical protein
MVNYILSIDTSIYLPILIAALFIEYFCLKKIFYNWYDPLLTELFFNSFRIAFVFYLFLDNKIDNFLYLITFIISNIAFFIGLQLGHSRLKPKIYSIENSKSINNIFLLYSKQLYVVLYFCVFIIFVAQVLQFLQFGTLPLFSENSETAKVAFRTGGFGFIYRINNALLPVSLSIVLIKLFHPVLKVGKHQFWILIIILIFLIFILLSGGSKGSIITLISFLFYCNLINQQYRNRSIINKLNFYVSFFFVLGILAVIFILWRAWISVQYLNVFEALFVRFVAFGDTFYYFYKYDLIDVFDYSPLDYLIASINPLLSLLRLREYKTALGERIITEGIGLVTGGFGVNSQHSIEGLIYFGVGLFWVYSLAVGYIISAIRTSLLIFILRKPHQLNLAIYMICSDLVLKLAIDSNTFFESLYSTFIIAIPIFLYVNVSFGSLLSSVKSAKK